MQYAILDWILEQKEDFNGKTDEIEIKSGVQLIKKKNWWSLKSLPAGSYKNSIYYIIAS